MKRKYSLEEKLEAIRLVEQGQSARSVSRELHLN
ncbi:MAG: transposase, partial [Bacteroidaceae bacterium]|nr:transposase [Bacteroidaceae bacterium]MBR4644212.1 transposase [Bacteroidaceae bacterium]MBR4644779.1 transposase [Bacteroidaceae bacterium]